MCGNWGQEKVAGKHLLAICGGDDRLVQQVHGRLKRWAGGGAVGEVGGVERVAQSGACEDSRVSAADRAPATGAQQALEAAQGELSNARLEGKQLLCA